jgi:hypothetical protein
VPHRALTTRDGRANLFPVGIAHSVVGGSASERPWRAVQRAAWEALGKMAADERLTRDSESVASRSVASVVERAATRAWLRSDEVCTRVGRRDGGSG